MVALRNFGALGCDVAGDNIASVVAVKYRGLLGCFVAVSDIEDEEESGRKETLRG